MGNLSLVSRSQYKVVTVEDMARHLRRTDTEEDDELIEMYIAAATAHVENWCGISLGEQTWDYWIDGFPATVNGVNQPIYLPRSPLLSVDAIGYRVDGSSTETSFSGYYTDIASMPGRVYIGSSGAWPAADLSQNAVRIRFRSGYVNESTASPPTLDNNTPADIKIAIMIYAATMYEYRESIVIGTAMQAQPLPFSAENLVRQYRIETSIA
jgi:uncharacterized phiE125 gp8 family phage protein